VSEILTVEELAARWKVDKGWIYRKAREGRLPGDTAPGEVRALPLGRHRGVRARRNQRQRKERSMSIHHITETEVRERALDHPCPDCGAAAGVRCRILSKTGGGNPGYPVNTRVDVRRKPCPDRVSLAWRGRIERGAA
jgi:predicted RNA-binding Zn-ribbon protein involved in translation (DUF1610 family)